VSIGCVGTYFTVGDHIPKKPMAITISKFLGEEDNLVLYVLHAITKGKATQQLSVTSETGCWTLIQDVFYGSRPKGNTRQRRSRKWRRNRKTEAGRGSLTISVFSCATPITGLVTVSRGEKIIHILPSTGEGS
jgi:hypothetical protein